MKDKFEKLNETFDIERTPEETSLSVPSEVLLAKNEIIAADNDITKDYEYTRGNLYSLIEKGQEAINGILDLAQQTDAPRAYEVAGQLIKNVADATDKLLDLQKKLRDIDETKIKGPTTVNNALYVGSTSDLLKLIKQSKQTDVP